MARPKSYPADLRDRLIRTAADLLAQGGPATLSLRELASGEGTSTNAIYTIFGGKTELIAAVVGVATDSFVQAQTEALGDGEDLLALRRLGLAYRQWALENPSLYRVMFGVYHSDAIPVPELDVTVPLRNALTRMIGQSLIRPVDVKLATRTLWAAVHGWTLLELTQGATFASEEHFNRHLEYVLLGLVTQEVRAQRLQAMATDSA